jgi:hypothetical protein
MLNDYTRHESLTQTIETWKWKKDKFEKWLVLDQCPRTPKGHNLKQRLNNIQIQNQIRFGTNS